MRAIEFVPWPGPYNAKLIRPRTSTNTIVFIWQLRSHTWSRAAGKSTGNLPLVAMEICGSGIYYCCILGQRGKWKRRNIPFLIVNQKPIESNWRPGCKPNKHKLYKLDYTLFCQLNLCEVKNFISKV